MCCSVPLQLTSCLSAVQVGILCWFFESIKCITSNRFVLNIVQGQHLQFRCHALLFHNFKQFKIKVL